MALVRWLPLIALLGLWELVADLNLVTPFMLPALSDVCQRIWDDTMSGDLPLNLAATLWRTLAGFAISAVLGVGLGMAMSQNRIVRWFFDPLISLGFPIPKVAFLPIMVLWLGLFDLSKITMIVFNDIFVVITATLAGVEGVEKELVWSARNFGTNGRRLVWDVLLPAALPQILTGLQVAMPVALILAIIVEMTMGGYGVGAAMQQSGRMADSPGVFAGIIEIGVVGYALVRLMALARRRLLAWHAEAAVSDT